jgi:hypothetical protein
VFTGGKGMKHKNNSGLFVIFIINPNKTRISVKKMKYPVLQESSDLW